MIGKVFERLNSKLRIRMFFRSPLLVDSFIRMKYGWNPRVKANADASPESFELLRLRLTVIQFLCHQSRLKKQRGEMIKWPC
ncbi:hypothetical protein PALU110988_11440 [Paenibacillus lupini]|nr:hypothetical protein [Paenibacillus lupini]